MPRPAYPLELVGDADWQMAAQSVWDALAALDEEQGHTALDMSCSSIVQGAYTQLARLADQDPAIAARAVTDLLGSVDQLTALFHIALRSRGGWFQELASAREGLDQLIVLIGPA